MSSTEYRRRTVGAGEERLVLLDRTDSTNEECKRRALTGAPDGLAVMAREQTGGKGRRGRSFLSLPDKGLYLSVLLYPSVPPETVSQLTAWTAVAAARAVERVSGITPGIKWPNDLLVDGKKLCGILTESGLCPRGLYVVLGIGVNLAQTADDFGPQLSDVAISLAQLGAPVSPRAMADTLLDELDAMYAAFPARRETWLEEYRRRCVTLGREVKIVTPTDSQEAKALDVDGDFALVIRTPDGMVRPVTAGEVSVRGMLGYS